MHSIRYNLSRFASDQNTQKIYRKRKILQKKKLRSKELFCNICSYTWNFLYYLDQKSKWKPLILKNISFKIFWRLTYIFVQLLKPRDFSESENLKEIARPLQVINGMLFLITRNPRYSQFQISCISQIRFFIKS